MKTIPNQSVDLIANTFTLLDTVKMISFSGSPAEELECVAHRMLESAKELSAMVRDLAGEYEPVEDDESGECWDAMMLRQHGTLDHATQGIKR